MLWELIAFGVDLFLNLDFKNPKVEKIQKLTGNAVNSATDHMEKEYNKCQGKIDKINEYQDSMKNTSDKELVKQIKTGDDSLQTIAAKKEYVERHKKENSKEVK